MSYLIITEPEAKDEIQEAYDYYESKQFGLGDEFLEYLEGYYDTLKTEIPFFEIKRKPYYRELPLRRFPYVIIYELRGSTIFIYSVFNTNQNPLGKRK
ncbi:MAG: type II toxin-antitoxin system RelE/ParE family toxin [Aequorivita sp.]